MTDLNLNVQLFREVERWAEFTPRSNSFPFLGMFGAQTKKREAEKWSSVRVENPVSERKFL